MEPLTLISEIQPLAPAGQPGGHPRHSLPFTQGQFLQGVIIAQQGPHQFTLELGGQQISTQSSAPLHVGQQLDLRVTTLSPQVQLQIIPANISHQRITGALHLLGQQAATLPELASLAQQALQLPDIKTQTRETLQWFTEQLTGSLRQNESAPMRSLTAQLLTRAAATLTSSGTAGHQFDAISRLLTQVASLPLTTTELRDRASSLAPLFASLANAPDATHIPLTPELVALSTLEASLPQELQSRLSQLAAQSPAAALLLHNLPVLFPEAPPSPQTAAIQQLVLFLADMGQALPPVATSPKGQELETVFNRLGMNLERLLAENKPDEAVRTLKHALLDLSHQLAMTEKSPQQADQLVKTIELYQLLQIRLANESLFFLPLPFAQFQQGYLLIDNPPDQSQQTGKKQGGHAQNIAIHLQLEGLGNLAIDIHQDDEGIALKFLAEDGERAKYLAGFRDELEQWLTTGRLDSVQFLVGAKDPTTCLLEKLVHGATGMIDTRA
jgi:hypothetical protein